MIEDLTTTSFSTVTASMGAIAVFNLIMAIKSKNVNKKISNALSVLINTIAFIHYIRMRNIWDQSKEDIVSVRYSDWFITCPLLLLEYFVLMEWINIDNNTGKINVNKELIFPIIVSIILTVAMLVCGYLAEKISNLKYLYFGIGCICLIALFIILHSNQKKIKQKENRKYPIFFIAIWALYGCVFLLPNYRDLFYNILDFIAKVLFAFMIGLF